MPTAGPSTCVNGSDDASIGSVAWTNPGLIVASDDSYATASITSANSSHYLVATKFLFAIPIDATILGDLTEWEVNDNFGTFTITDSRARLVINGVIGTGDRSSGTAWPDTLDAFLSHGGAADTWGESLTPAIVNADNYGAALQAQTSSVPGTQARVDSCRKTITYSLAADPGQTHSVTRAVGQFHPGFITD